MSEGGLSQRLASVRDRIASAAERAGRDPAGIHILAVTKGHPASTIEAALAVGLTDIGESRVQEAQAKHRLLAGRAATWHMIGHLQRNKARAAASIFDVVHSVEAAPVAETLDHHRSGERSRLRVLLEVELTGIDGRSGVTPGEVSGLLGAVRLCPHLEPVGLMTIAPPGAPEAARDCFERLRALRDRLVDFHGLAMPELSMGMSDDFEIAVAQGATMIRLGRVLFGDRPAGR